MVNSLDELYEFALSLYGIPYQWGGEYPIPLSGPAFGLDCSGTAKAISRKGGIPLPKEDLTADGLYRWFKNNGTIGLRQRGALAFFGTEGAIEHVGWMIDDKIMLSAAGGGRSCSSRVAAAARAAFVKIQPISWYKFPAFVDCIMPHYSFWFDRAPVQSGTPSLT